MGRIRTLMCWAYALIAVVALVITYSQYLPFPTGGFLGLEGFWADLKVNHTARGISVDLAFFLLAAALFMVGEARRLKMRFVWLYLFAGYFFDISVAFPVFLIMRERAMARAGEAADSLTSTDLVAFAATAGVVIWQVWFVLS